MYPRWIWRVAALPGTLWLSVFFLVAFYAVICVAFGNTDTLQQPVPFWNPLDWNVGYVVQELRNLWHGGAVLDVFLRTIRYVVIAIALSLLIGFPVAYFAARHAGRWRGIVLMLLIIPFWINYLMRMIAWQSLLAPDGYGSRFFHDTGIEWIFMQLGLLETQGGWLQGQSSAVVLALVYGYVPYLVLPLYAALDRIDRRTIEAARDLGATPRSAFMRVTLPQAVPGLLAGLVLITLPMFGDYYTPDLISTTTATSMIGNQIDGRVNGGSEKVSGAVLTIFLSLFLLVLMVYYLRQTRSAGREVEAE